jgi:hypothetical protein
MPRTRGGYRHAANRSGARNFQRRRAPRIQQHGEKGCMPVLVGWATAGAVLVAIFKRWL